MFDEQLNTSVDEELRKEQERKEDEVHLYMDEIQKDLDREYERLMKKDPQSIQSYQSFSIGYWAGINR